jgi:xanthine dehydrogenase YagS FAD-binding subunit
MQNFEYANPTSLKEAYGLLGSTWGEADVLAGGTDLISLMKDFVHTPKRVVNIKGIKELGGISKAGSSTRIGATVTLDELASNAIIRASYPSLVQAALGITSPQLRNMGTVGGDLVQRPRCWYFRKGFGLLAKNMVPAGENKFHAIFGGGPAYFVSPSSLGPALIGLGATVKLASAKGVREVPASAFFLAPKEEGQRETDLKPNEILTEILIPSAATKNATYEVREREAVDWPLATASVSLKMKGSTIDTASIVLGHVAPTPWPATQAAQWLSGKTISVDTAEQAGAAAVAGAKPLSQNSYKVQLAKVAVKRALLTAAGIKV